MQNTYRALLAAALAFACSSLPAHADVIIDSFIERNPAHWPLTTTANSSGLTGDTETGLSTVAGGTRAAALGNSLMNIPGFDNVSVDIYNQNGFSFLDYQSSVGANSTFELGYGSSNSLNIAGATALVIDFIDYDAAHGGSLHIQATMLHEVSPGLSLGPVYSFDVTQPGAQSVVIPLTDYPYSDVDSMVIDFTAPKGADYRIDSISVAVPEPASLALLGLVIPTLLRRRAKSS